MTQTFFHAEMHRRMRPFNLRFLSGHGLLIGCLLAAAARPASAEITPSRVFSDNVVLQRDAPLAVWGTSTAETKVTVEFANQVKSCVPETDGSWLVRLDPVAASGEPRDLVIRGTAATTLKNVLVGDVWIYAGGAEINRPATGDIKLPDAGLPQVRIFAIGEATSRQVESDTKATWAVVGSQNLNRLPGLAVCLGQELHRDLAVPIGIVTIAAGLPVESWMSRETLVATPAAAPILDYYASDAWKLQTAATYEERLKAWMDYSQKLPLNPPPKPLPTDKPEQHARQEPSGVWNAAVAPLVRMAVRGVVWDGGDDKASLGRAIQQGTLLSTLIAAWRKAFDMPTLPFVIVQLRPHRSNLPGGVDGRLVAEMRDAQGRAAAKASAPLVTTIDLGADPQPAVVAPRIARTILSAIYKNTPDAIVGPELASAETVGDTIRLRMKCRNGGLAKNEKSLAGFAIAASPFRWVWANAEMSGDTIVLSAPGIKSPQAARYAYEDLPSHGATLVDSAGNPAAPFRTDRFYELSSEVVSPGDKPHAYDVRTVMIEDPRLPRILLLGDSISGGYFPGVRQRLDGQGTVLGETAFTGQGKAAYRFYTSPAALREGGLATFLAERGPFDIVHFNMGIHEFAWVNAPNYLKGKKLTEADPAHVKTEADAYAARLRDVVALIRKAGAVPVFATSTATKADGVIAHFPYYLSNCQAFNAAAERTMRELDVRVVDIYGLIQPRIEEFISGDLIHFKPEASAEMATLIAAQLRDKLGTRPRRDDAAPGKRHDLSARASQIDPLAKEHPEIGFIFNDDKGKPMDLQHAVVDTRVPPQGKLVIWLMDHSQPLFERISSYGLHGIQVHYANRWFGGLKPEVRDSGDVLGRIRLEASTGEDASPLVDIPKPDGMAERARQFLLWLDREHPEGRWGQFLTEDRREVRWETVCMAGISHGATTAARFAVHQPVDRVVMLSGPRDNTETWQGMPSATPANRFFGFSHVLDSGWTADHYCRSWQLLRLNEFGPVVNVDEVPFPYGNTRRLITTADVDNNPGRAHTTVVPGGSSVKNAAGAMVHEPVWRYLFTHPVEQTGAAAPPDADCSMDRQTAHGVPPTAPAPPVRP